MKERLFLIGNGFDLAHGMPTQYSDFKNWLIRNNRIDVILELQNAYPIRSDKDYLLWSDFEAALGEYDLEKVINWSWEDLYLTSYSIGGQQFDAPDLFLNTQLPEIINNAFSRWIHSIKIPSVRAYQDIGPDALYLTFNYTDTLEQLYHIPECQVLHIHGRASRKEKLVVGHKRMIDPSEYWDDSLDIRENNERMQRLADMNSLCKPVYEIIEQNGSFFNRLGTAMDIHIIGHSCEEVDYPYFRKVKESVALDTQWHFYPFVDNDKVRVNRLVSEIDITNYKINVI